MIDNLEAVLPVRRVRVVVYEAVNEERMQKQLVGSMPLGPREYPGMRITVAEVPP